jgi:hypothetical protein
MNKLYRIVKLWRNYKILSIFKSVNLWWTFNINKKLQLFWLFILIAT